MDVFFLIPVIFSIIVAITIFVSVIISAVKTASNSENVREKVKNFKTKLFNDLEDSLGIKKEEEPTVTCEYCKSIYAKKEKKCPNCGAGNKNKK